MSNPQQQHPKAGSIAIPWLPTWDFWGNAAPSTSAQADDQYCYVQQHTTNTDTSLRSSISSSSGCHTEPVRRRRRPPAVRFNLVEMEKQRELMEQQRRNETAASRLRSTLSAIGMSSSTHSTEDQQQQQAPRERAHSSHQTYLPAVSSNAARTGSLRKHFSHDGPLERPDEPTTTAAASVPQSATTSSAFDMLRMFRVESALSLFGYGSTSASTGSVAGDTQGGTPQINSARRSRRRIHSRHVRRQMRLVQETDACFFENFGSLGSKIESAKRDFINRMPHKRRRGSARRLSFQLARFKKPNEKLREDLYIEVLYTIFHRVGISATSAHAPTLRQLQNYAQDAFRMSDDRHDCLLEAAKDEKLSMLPTFQPPVIILNVVVCEARNIVAKDTDGFSDPFCMLGIVPNKRQSHHPTSDCHREERRVSVTNQLLPGEPDSGHCSPANTVDHEASTTTSTATTTSSGHGSGGGGFFNRVRSSMRKKSKSISSRRRNSAQLANATEERHEPTTSSGASKAQQHRNSVANEQTHHHTTTSAQSSCRQSRETLNEEDVTIPAKLIKATSVQPNTLNPIWNEKFQLIVEDSTADRFHLDIWDHDQDASVVDSVSQLNEVSNLRGLGRFFKQVAKSARRGSNETADDFLGSVTLPIKDVTAKGIEQWFPLQPRSAKSIVDGDVLLKMWLGTREDRIGHDEGDNMLDIQQHISIIRIFVDHEIHTNLNGDASKWTGNFSPEATAILHQHAIQGDLTDAQRAMCHWIAHCWLHFYEPLSYGFIYERLNGLLSKWEPTTLSKDEEEMLAECFSQFLQHSYQQLLHHRENFPSCLPGSALNIEYLLRCLTMLHECEHFKRVLPFQRELYTELVTLVQRSSMHFFNRVKGMLEAREGCESDDSYAALAKLITIINAACAMATSCYADPFLRVTGIDYFTLTYLEFDQMLQGELCAASIAENWERGSLAALTYTSVTPQQSVVIQRILLPLFELHMCLTEFVSYRSRCDNESGGRAQLRTFTHFFEKTVTKWLTYCKDLLLARIDLACQLDKKIEADSTEIKQSTSYVDVCFSIKQVLDFWDRVIISNPSKRAAFTERLVQLICQALEHYTDSIFSCLAQTGFYEGTEQNTEEEEDNTEDCLDQFCITINDAEQARRVVSDLGDKLRMDDITVALETKQDKTSALKWRSSIEHVVDSCRSCIAGQMDMALQRLIDRQKDTYSRHVFHMAWSPKGCDIEKAIQPLLDQLDKDMSNYHQWLLHRNFVRYLNALFKCILSLLETSVCENQGQGDDFHQRLGDALLTLTDFFHAGGRGLSLETIAEISVYRKINKAIKLLATPTPKLIERYYRNLQQQQAELTECKFGILNVRVYFNSQADLLVIDVLSAKRIIPLDTNGLSDPFVIVELVPHHCFRQCPVVKTKVCPKTLNPIYDESFEFTVYEHDLPECAMIHFVVMDHDFLRSNDFAGEGFIDFVDVPGFGNHTGAAVALRQFNLVLMHPNERNQEEEIQSVLKARQEDTLAVEFTKHIANVRYT